MLPLLGEAVCESGSLQQVLKHELPSEEVNGPTNLLITLSYASITIFSFVCVCGRSENTVRLSDCGIKKNLNVCHLRWTRKKNLGCNQGCASMSNHGHEMCRAWVHASRHKPMPRPSQPPKAGIRIPTSPWPDFYDWTFFLHDRLFQ